MALKSPDFLHLGLDRTNVKAAEAEKLGRFATPVNFTHYKLPNKQGGVHCRTFLAT